MPVYVFACTPCSEQFEKVMTVQEREHETVACPRCGSTEEVQRVLTPFFAKTSRKS